LLKPKFKYILSFAAALLAYRGFRALVYISAKVLAAGGSLALLVFMLFASSNARVTTILKSGKLVVILSLLYKN
jgi:hypothetical protein